MSIGKMYFARFTDKETKEVFFKFGHTSSWDAMERFLHQPEQYEKWDIKIMKTVAGPLEEMKGVEEAFKAFYPKNFWLEEKISGVTEIVKLATTDIKKIIDTMEFLGTKYYQKRERERLKSQQEYNLNG